ncbi:MAG: type II toxin-antitoxin system RelE/ParE family toxin, partial [Ignavibacteria bacterium]|nr:type II toxin-antitoxin system RelE/ParE family toxin [Ignavibacteria bacterium]
MKVVITDFALKEIKAIHRYYQKNASRNIADKLVNKIPDAIELLEYSSQTGTDEALKELNLNHRYIVTDNYKIIFRSTNDYFYVTDVFDTRQN